MVAGARPHTAALEVLLCQCSGGAIRCDPGEVSLRGAWV